MGSGAIKIMTMDSAKCDSSHEDKSASASHGPDIVYARSRKTKGHSGWNFSGSLAERQASSCANYLFTACWRVT